MYFPDLTPYQYGRTEPQQNVLNVGWLSAAQSFRRGDPDEPFVNAERRDELIQQKEEELMDLFRTALPDMSITPDFSWAGTLGITKDSMPYIGTHPGYENSFFTLGYGGNGITFSLMAMKMLSDHLAGRDNKFREYFKFNR